jgi:hypothetical protein
MPSFRHQALVELFRQSPRLALQLLEALKVEVPKNIDVRADDSDLSAVKPVHRHADLVVLAESKGTKKLTIVVEVQLSRKEQKRLAWPSYAVLSRVRHRCPAAVLVVCPTAAVARWARRPIEIGPGHFYAPWVLGPEEIPAIASVEAARKNVELAVLSAVAHASMPLCEAKPVVEAALQACDGLPPDDRLVYSDLILEALGPALKEALMTMPKGYKFQTEFIRNIAARYADTETIAEARGRTFVLERLLTRKFGPLSSEILQRLRGGTVNDVETWTDRVLTADSLDAVFGS